MSDDWRVEASALPDEMRAIVALIEQHKEGEPKPLADLLSSGADSLCRALDALDRIDAVHVTYPAAYWDSAVTQRAIGWNLAIYALQRALGDDTTDLSFTSANKTFTEETAAATRRALDAAAVRRAVEGTP